MNIIIDQDEISVIRKSFKISGRGQKEMGSSLSYYPSINIHLKHKHHIT